ncbi:DUF6364 family protein [Hymenobacter sp. BRD67]|uniref:DUF6364 family protein n=1 Tax=Hymenobacter sp. BRD67 TaxID=2675877 RepID=UPI001567BF15|nr:DUF6364 family protein [Hymenobacter sp. BRD67]QKG51281.1 hypothetical protein GKZ67_00185 [Hymenobacter sp. BRD67]
MSQVVITLDESLLSDAEAYARQHGQPLDALVAELLQAAVRPPAQQSLTTLVQELYGSLKAPSDFDYRAELGEALEQKYGL